MSNQSECEEMLRVVGTLVEGESMAGTFLQCVFEYKSQMSCKNSMLRGCIFFAEDREELTLFSVK